MKNRDIEQLYRRSALNPGRFTLWFWGWMDGVTLGRVVIALVFVAAAVVVVLVVVWWVLI